MQSLTHPTRAAVLEPSFPGVYTDYKTLCAPHVPAIRDVLEGKTYRYKVKFDNATFVFHHGCLMIQVVHDGLIRALPPFAVEEDGTPYLRALPEHQQFWMEEFMELPKSVLLFYFSLLKEVFKGYALGCRWQDPDTGRMVKVPVPDVLHPLLSEVGWYTR